MSIYLPITTLMAIILASVYLLQTWSVISVRRQHGIVHGSHGNKTIEKRIRGHANMSEQAPFFMGLIMLAEIQQLVSNTWLWSLTSFFLIGRLMHAYYFLDIGGHYRFRVYGMLFTLMAQFAVILTLVSTLTY